ncbi:hypothetical protein ACHAO7_011817 [Fusarium culmorum]
MECVVIKPEWWSNKPKKEEKRKQLSDAGKHRRIAAKGETAPVQKSKASKELRHPDGPANSTNDAKDITSAASDCRRPHSSDANCEFVHALRCDADASTNSFPATYPGDRAFCASTLTLEQVLKDREDYLEGHFYKHIQPLLFPALRLERNRGISFIQDLSAVNSMTAYRHACLSAAAKHLRSLFITGLEGWLDEEMVRHRDLVPRALVQSIEKNENRAHQLQTVLTIVNLRAVVDTSDDSIFNIPWSKHSAIATEVLQCSQHAVTEYKSAPSVFCVPFHMAAFCYMDILNGAMRGESPAMATRYFKAYHSPRGPRMGLLELTGCDDRVMCLISEIACLESHTKKRSHSALLGGCIITLESAISDIEVQYTVMPREAGGHPSRTHVRNCITLSYIVAARLYLRSLAPGFCPISGCTTASIDQLAEILSHIPLGLDNSIIWVYYVGGSLGCSGSLLRPLLRQRLQEYRVGSLWKLYNVLGKVWSRNDEIEHGWLSGEVDLNQLRFATCQDIMEMNELTIC